MAWKHLLSKRLGVLPRRSQLTGNFQTLCFVRYVLGMAVGYNRSKPERDDGSGTEMRNPTHGVVCLPHVLNTYLNFQGLPRSRLTARCLRRENFAQAERSV